jgi:[lysine-biosynthesis-protein LysW]---L-2-aminoadipate ligase
VSNGPTLGLFLTIVRPEEKAILAAAERRGVPVVRFDDREVTFGLERPDGLPSVLLNRSVSHTRSVYAGRCFQHYGVPTVNEPDVLELAGDKVRTSLRLQERGVPTPRTVVALSAEAARKAIETVGYPAVLKPAIGSWGRLLAKVDTAEDAEQILEHKEALASPIHSVFYVQEYVEKPGRDLRAFVVGEEVVAAMFRRSESWRTNSARGAVAEPAPLTPELREMSLRAAEAVGGGVLAVDLMEGKGGLVVHEVNPTPEFKALQGTTEVDIAEKIVDYALRQGRQ